MQNHIPITALDVAHLFPEVRAELLAVLANLDDADWQRPTACEGWSVRDVAVHLLGDYIGMLSGMRDQDGQYGQFERWEELVAFIDAQNERWVAAGRRISRRLLLALLDFTGRQLDAFISMLDPQALSGPVSWAGSEPAPIWLHTARELTEHWMHHQHICDAVGRRSLKEARYVGPVLATFMHALPHTYRQTQAAAGTVVEIVITGAGGGRWHLLREEAGWRLYAATGLEPAAVVTMDVETAWRLFTRGLDAKAARQQSVIEGDAALGRVVLETVAIIA